jgi:hypothetical protein
MPSRQEREPVGTEGFDAEYRGVSLLGERAVYGTSGSLTVRTGLSSGRLTSLALLPPPCVECLALWAPTAETSRQLVAGQLSAVRTYTPKGRARITPSFAVDAAAGRTFDAGWVRTQVQGGLAISNWAGVGLDLQAMAGQLTAGAPTYERFAIGGAESPYVDPLFLQGRWAAPGQGFGVLTGTSAFRARAALTGPIAPFVQVDRVGSGGAGQERRLVGFESAVNTPALSVARFPATRSKFGIAMPLDGPHAKQPVFYTTIVLTP